MSQWIYVIMFSSLFFICLCARSWRHFFLVVCLLRIWCLRDTLTEILQIWSKYSHELKDEGLITFWWLEDKDKEVPVDFSTNSCLEKWTLVMTEFGKKTKLCCRAEYVCSNIQSQLYCQLGVDRYAFSKANTDICWPWMSNSDIWPIFKADIYFSYLTFSIPKNYYSLYSPSSKRGITIVEAIRLFTLQVTVN